MTDKMIFISYATEDREFALKLAADLKMAGADVWIDQLNIPLGQPWDKAIEEALKSCSSLLIILSDSSVESDDVRNEIHVALKKGKVVIPVLYKICEIPLQISRLNYCSDFTANYEVGLRRLAKELKLSLPEKKTKVKPIVTTSTKTPTGTLPKQGATKAKHSAQYAKREKLLTGTKTLVLRARPIDNLSEELVQEMLRNMDYYDADWNKEGRGFRNELKILRRNGCILVRDEKSDLIWEQSGSPDTMSFKEAKRYIKWRNKEKYAGYSDWRLPTLEEAMSLMKPQKGKKELYVDKVFDSKQQNIWTADGWAAPNEPDSPQAWSVYYIMGDCTHCSLDFYGLYVRAVR